jgi:hypothetical protein
MLQVFWVLFRQISGVLSGFIFFVFSISAFTVFKFFRSTHLYLRVLLLSVGLLMGSWFSSLSWESSALLSFVLLPMRFSGDSLFIIWLLEGSLFASLLMRSSHSFSVVFLRCFWFRPEVSTFLVLKKGLFVLVSFREFLIYHLMLVLLVSAERFPRVLFAQGLLALFTFRRLLVPLVSKGFMSSLGSFLFHLLLGGSWFSLGSSWFHFWFFILSVRYFLFDSCHCYCFGENIKFCIHILFLLTGTKM